MDNETFERPIKPQQFADMIGVTVRTLQRWDNDGILVARRTPTNRRYYTMAQYREYIGAGKPRPGDGENIERKEGSLVA